MNYSDSGYSLSDIAAATGNNNRNNDGFGDGSGAWWIVVFLIFAMFGFGRNGNGLFGGNGSNGAADNYVLASDFATIQRQLSDGFGDLTAQSRYIQNGICDGFYAMNTGMLNGFSGVQQAMCQGFSNINQAVVNQGYETRLGSQALASQLASCCCDIRQQISDCCCTTNANIKDVNYNMAMNTNAIQNSMCLNTRDLIENQNNGTRAILDALTANRIEDKNAQITAQQNEINALRLAASQSAQNEYLVNQLRPMPQPAFLTCNPYTGQVYGGGNCCNSGCNCGNY